jgi:surface carbohydrate biosynthesis protein
MKRLRLVSNRKIDLLIIDEEGSDAVQHCVPDNVSYSILPVRNAIPFLFSIKFFIKFFVKIINNKNMRFSALLSFIEVLSPSVIISFIDNAERNGKLQDIFPDKLVISVQNGLRTVSNGFPNKVPVLYGFGNYEHDLLISVNARIKEYIPAGSLKFSIFMDKYAKSCKERKYDICYVSSFNFRAYTGLIETTPAGKVQEELYPKIVSICQKRGYSLSVAMKSQTKESDMYLQELQYFQNMDKHNYATYIGNSNEKFTSYCVALSSEIILGISSTLIYEMYGYGKKVLFLGAGSLEMQNSMKSVMNFSRLAEDVCIRSMNKDNIEKQLLSLKKKDNDNYLSAISESQSYYMNYGKEFTHHVIKERIRSFVYD